MKNKDFWIICLKWSLAVIFMWFGTLKVFGYNPVYEIVAGTFPLLATPTGNFFLGLFETTIGLFLVINIFSRTTHALLVLHLLGTFLTFVTNPSLMFDPVFPILSLSGEFVFKNATLAMSGLVILTHKRNL